MKFYKFINWKKYFKYVLYSIIFTTTLYILSGNYPKYFYALIISNLFFAIGVLLAAYSNYLSIKNIKKDEEN